MKLRVYTKEEFPEEREAIDLAKRVENQGYQVDYFDLNEEESHMSAEVYDIYSSPALVVTQDDGKLAEIWQTNLPTESELFNFMRS